MFSLRDLIWSTVYGHEVPETLQTKEIVVAAAIAVALLALYWVFQKIIFHGVNDSAPISRTGARVMAIALSLGWLTAALDIFGMWTSIAMLVAVALTMLLDIVYLFVTRRA